MKKKLATKGILLGFVGLLAGADFAAADPKQRRSDRMLINEKEERYVMVTGSHIPQKVRLRSIGTETPYNVRIYTQRELMSTGRFTVGAAVAALEPSARLVGGYGR